MYINVNKLTLLSIFIAFTYTLASEGDRSPFYQKCTKSCMKVNCTEDGWSFTPQAVKHLEYSSRLLWNCRDECRYHCMWRTVQGFHERGYQTPKFHGKWPFKRLLGVQEPASVFASLLNLAVNVYTYVAITRQFSVKPVPMVVFWKLFTVICIHAWIWSIVFHTRDNQFTEFMDYAFALSVVMALFAAAVLRVFHTKKRLVLALLLATVVWYLKHLYYLAVGSVDYGYNMMVNLVFGVSGSVLWLLWGCFQYYSGRRHAWRLVAFVLLSGGALALELLDFAPRRHWDAHALWHLSTAPLALLFYRFVIDDLRYTQTAQGIEKVDSKSA